MTFWLDLAVLRVPFSSLPSQMESLMNRTVLEFSLSNTNSIFPWDCEWGNCSQRLYWPVTIRLMSWMESKESLLDRCKISAMASWAIGWLSTVNLCWSSIYAFSDSVMGRVVMTIRKLSSKKSCMACVSDINAVSSIASGYLAWKAFNSCSMMGRKVSSHATSTVR